MQFAKRSSANSLQFLFIGFLIGTQDFSLPPSPSVQACVDVFYLYESEQNRHAMPLVIAMVDDVDVRPHFRSTTNKTTTK